MRSEAEVVAELRERMLLIMKCRPATAPKLLARDVARLDALADYHANHVRTLLWVLGY